MQDTIAIAIVLGAIFILAKKTYASVQKMAQGTCGGCSSCAAENSCPSSKSKSNEQISFQV